MIPNFLLKAVSRTTVAHKERLQGKEVRIFIPNHTSLLDAVILASHLPKDVVFVANTQIMKDYKFAMGEREVLAINPMNPYSIRQMLRILKEGKSLVIFPEGKITVTNSLMKIYPGVAYLSIKTGIPLVPIALNGGEKAKFFTYLEGKIPTRYFPKTSMYVGEAFTIPVKESMTMREKKEFGKTYIYRKMQDTLFHSRMRNDVHLVNALRERVKEAPKMVIAEEVSATGLKRTTMKELWFTVLAFSKILEDHLSKADHRVGILLPTTTYTVSAIYALLKLGKTPAMLNFSMDTATLNSCLKTGEILTVITSRLFIEKAKLESFVEANKETIKFLYLEDFKDQITSSLKMQVFLEQNKKVSTPANDILLFTSGSEGTPKGVLLTHQNIYANIQQARLMIDFTSQDKIANALPLFHSFGLILTFLSTLCLVPSVYIPSPLMFKAIPEIVYDRNVTIMLGTSTFLSGYGRYAEPYDFARLRYVYCGGEKLQEHVRTYWMEKFGIRIMEGYGLTETAPILAIQSPILYAKSKMAIVPGVKYKIEEKEGIENGGSLLIKAPNLMKGYLISGKGFVEQPKDEYFDTGDIVTLSDHGLIQIQDRSKRFAKIGGEMISLSVVEAHARNAIQEGDVCAVRIADKRKGERIELVTTNESVTKEQLRQHWKDFDITPLSLPHKVHFMKEIPHLGSGKVDFTKVTKEIQSLYE